MRERFINQMMEIPRSFGLIVPAADDGLPRSAHASDAAAEPKLTSQWLKLQLTVMSTKSFTIEN